MSWIKNIGDKMRNETGKKDLKIKYDILFRAIS